MFVIIDSFSLDATDRWPDSGRRQSSISPQGQHHPNRKTAEHRLKKTTHAERSKPHKISHGKLAAPPPESQGLDEDSPKNPSPPVYLPSSTISLYYTPNMADPLTSSPISSSCPNPSATPITSFDPAFSSHRGERINSSRGFDADIGELGKRRGFKGAPLFTQATSQTLSFLSLPPSFSPRVSVSGTTSDRLTSPRSPLEAVTNLIRSGSTKSVKLAVKPLVSQNLQDSYDGADPFCTFGNEFFTPNPSLHDIPTSNLNDFGPYYQRPRTHRRALKRNPSSIDLRWTCPRVKRHTMKTTIYDLSVSDVPCKPMYVTRNTGRPRGPSILAPCRSPRITLTVPSAPSSPIKKRSTSGSSETPLVTLSTDTQREPRTTNDEPKIPTDDVGSYFVSNPSNEPFVPSANLYGLAVYGGQPNEASRPKTTPVLGDLRNISPIAECRPKKPRLQAGNVKGEGLVSHITERVPRQSVPKDINTLIPCLIISLTDIQIEENEGVQYFATGLSSAPSNAIALQLKTSSERTATGVNAAGQSLSDGGGTEAEHSQPAANNGTISSTEELGISRELNPTQNLSDMIPLTHTAPISQLPRGPFLRPLVLPTCLANRSTTTPGKRSAVDNTLVPRECLSNDASADRRTKGLDDIIALLDACVSDFAAHERSNASAYCLPGDEGPIVQTSYAI